MNYDKAKRTRLIFCSVYLLVALCLLPFYRFQINPDGIAYLSIARHYGAGRWMQALNNCWPPLYSWLIAPWTALVEEPSWVAKFYNILAGTGCIWFSQQILSHYKVKPFLQISCLVVMTGFCLIWAFILVTPDILSVWFMLWYSYLVISGKLIDKPVYAGLIAALAYFAKSYCLFFIGAHLLFHYSVLLFSKAIPFNKLSKGFLLTVTTTGLILFAWMLLLYPKYHSISLSSASAWTHGSLKYPNFNCINQFVPPPYPESVFAWEDPPRLCPHQDWSLFESAENVRLQLQTITKNIKGLLSFQVTTGYFHLLGFVWIVLTVAFNLNGRWKIKSFREMISDPLFVFLPLILIYIFGYLLIFIEPRYIWIAYAWITIALFTALNRLPVQQRINVKWAAGGILLLSAFIVWGVSRDQSRMLVPIKKIFAGNSVKYNGEEFYRKAKLLGRQSAPQTNIACLSERNHIIRAQNWGLAYYTGWRHHGILSSDSATAMALIAQYKIGIVILHKDDELPVFLQAQWKKMEPSAGDIVAYQKQ